MCLSSREQGVKEDCITLYNIVLFDCSHFRTNEEIRSNGTNGEDYKLRSSWSLGSLQHLLLSGDLTVITERWYVCIKGHSACLRSVRSHCTGD
jgi:hypothetical protein